MTTGPKDTIFLHSHSLNIRGEIKVFHRPLIMGILNLTPDSFYDKSRHSDPGILLKKAEEMLKDGADILDLGAYSSRPGAEDIPINEELDRLMPALKSVRKEFPETIISVDTFRSTIADAAGMEGADMINDISGGMLDSEMYSVVARQKLVYILMHMRGNPQNMQDRPVYDDVVAEVYRYFSDRINLAREKGINDIIIDPGFGFGKRLEDNFELLRSLKEFRSFNCMILAGLSRKSMINKVLNVKAEQALNGTTALNTIALQNGASILRVHDVIEAKEVAELVSYYQKA